MSENRFANLATYQLTKEEQGSVMELALKIVKNRFRRGRALESPGVSVAYLQVELADRQNEVFGCIWLDNRHRILGHGELFQGGLRGSMVEPRVVVQQALDHNAAAVIFYHNHPSGVAEPSRADDRLTGRLKEALDLFEVKVLDHLIVSGTDHISYAENGRL